MSDESKTPPDPPAANQIEAALVKLRVTGASTSPPLHANFAQVAHNTETFAVVFCEHIGLPGRVQRDDATGETLLIAEVVASLRLPPNQYLTIVATLAHEWNRFAAETYSDQENVPRFELSHFPEGWVGLETLRKAGEPHG
jgi:hypothetical protein